MFAKGWIDTHIESSMLFVCFLVSSSKTSKLKTNYLSLNMRLRESGTESDPSPEEKGISERRSILILII